MRATRSTTDRRSAAPSSRPRSGGIGHAESQSGVVGITVGLGGRVRYGLGEAVLVRRVVAEAGGAVDGFVGRQPGVRLCDGRHLVFEVVAARRGGDEL